MQGEWHSRPPPCTPQAFSTKNVEKTEAKEMSKHSTGSQGGFSPLAHTYSGETNMKKKNIIGLQHQNKTKINPHCGVKTDYWTHEVRHIKI